MLGEYTLKDFHFLQASHAHHRATLDPDQFDINARKIPFDPWVQYANSKILLMHLSKELSVQLQGTQTQSVVVHPGGKFNPIMSALRITST